METDLRARQYLTVIEHWSGSSMMQDTIIKNAMKRADGTKDFCIEKNYRNRMLSFIWSIILDYTCSICRSL